MPCRATSSKQSAMTHGAAAGAGMLLALMALASCSSSSSPQPTPPTSSVGGGHATTAPAASGDARTVAAIKKAYVDFFSGDTTADTKIDLVQNGLAFAQVINAQAGTAIAKGTTASVSKVTVVSPIQANVIYSVSLGGTPALKNQAGLAVDDGGTWKVGTATFCALLTLEQQAPAICQGQP